MRDYVSTVKNLREASKGLLFDAMPYRASVMRDAADAIEELVKEVQNRENDCINLTGECATYYAQIPHWISVEERLPDEDMEVLISYRYKEGEGDTNHMNIDITTYGQMYFGGREVERVKHWRPPFEYFSSNYEVVAWMPLPEAPKEVE